MKKIILFIVFGLSLLLVACSNSDIIYTQNDFLRTFNTRLEEEELNYYMLVSFDANKKEKTTEMMGFNKNKDLQVEIIFDKMGNITRFGLLTNKIEQEDLNKIIAIIKETFPSQSNYDIKEGASPSGYKGIGFILKDANNKNK